MQWTLIRNNYDDVMSDFNPHAAWRLFNEDLQQGLIMFNEDLQQGLTMVRRNPVCS